MRFSSTPITFIWIAVNFVFLNCIFTTMNHLKTGKNRREEVKCEESLIYRVDVLRNSASNVNRLPQIWPIPVNYPLWSFIPQNTTDYNFIPKYPFMTSFPSLVQARFLLLTASSHQVPPFSTVTAATSRRHFEFSTSNLKKSGWTFQVGIRKAGACASVTVSL